jgi:DNA-binding response OmpR family regulator
LEVKKAHILIVDDEVINLHILADLIGEAYRVQFARNGTEALEIIDKEARDIDLILLDVVMPELDGYELCKILKEHQDTQDIPIIFVTSKQSEEDELYGLSLGAIDYIVKPFRSASIKQKIYNHIELRDRKKNSLSSQNEFQDLIIDIENAQIKKGNELIFLSKKERELLDLFLRYQNRILSKEEIEYSLWNGEIRADSSVKTLIRKVRLKIGEECIETVKNIGYRLNQNVKVTQK